MPLTTPADFDPLVEFYGNWNTQLAERYLPIPETHARKYECVGGYLVMSPHEGVANSVAELALGAMLLGPAKAAGLLPCLQTNVLFSPETWLIPDLTVLRGSPVNGTWIDPGEVLLVAEFVSQSSRRRDRVDKPKLYAEGGIPWYLRAEVDRDRRTAHVQLDRLDGDRYVEHAVAHEGQRFVTAEPFELAFDPADLLEPRG